MAPTTTPDTPYDFGPRRLLDVKAAAKLTGLSERTVRTMFDERQIPLVRVGTRRLRVWSNDLAEYLAAHTLPARAEVTR